MKVAKESELSKSKNTPQTPFEKCIHKKNIDPVFPVHIPYTQSRGPGYDFIQQYNKLYSVFGEATWHFFSSFHHKLVD